MKKQSRTVNLKSIFLLFLSWRIGLFLILFLSISFLPLNFNNFLGGGFKNYQIHPVILSWANFDGEHYLAIAKNGYRELDHSFFPLYPILMSLLGFGIKNNLVIAIAGILISNLSFLIVLIFFWKLLKMDYQQKQITWILMCLIFFPVSFYFASVYTESLFLALTLACFYFARVNKWWLVSLLGALASATRITGIILLPALLVEWWIQRKNSVSPLSLIFIPSGLIVYMVYLWITAGNPLAFYNELSMYGVQRSGNFVLLPQVFYRYFNMLTNVSTTNFIYWTISFEFAVTVLVMLVLIYGYFLRVRISYLVFGILAFILPTLTGSFSSMPRYILVIFPAFIAGGIMLSKLSLPSRILITIFLCFLLIIEAALFLRGFWVA